TDPGRRQRRLWGRQLRARFLHSRAKLPPTEDKSAETARDVVLGELVPRIRENIVRVADFDELSQMEVRSALRHERGLLHGMRDDDDRVILLELVDEILDACRGDRGERRRL